MAEIITEKQICNACGADVREGALFCYYCGGAVASEIAVSKSDKSETVDEIPLTITAKSAGKESENGFELEAKNIETKQKDTEILIEAATKKQLTEPNPQKAAKLESAAGMRGKSKLVQPQRVEIIWEERGAAPNVWFILAALILTLSAAAILFIALRLK